MVWTRNEGGVFGEGDLCVLLRVLSTHKTYLFSNNQASPLWNAPTLAHTFPLGEEGEPLTDHGFCCSLSTCPVPKTLCTARLQSKEER